MATASPFIIRMRNFFLGRNLQIKYNNRMPEVQSTRSIPAPELPDGVSHKLNKNSYCLRDGRRVSQPPTVVFSPMQLLAEPPADGEKPAVSTEKKKVPLLGIAKAWKISEDEPYMRS